MVCVLYMREKRCRLVISGGDSMVVGVDCYCFFFQAEDGIRDAQESRGLGDVYKRQHHLVATGRFEVERVVRDIVLGQVHIAMQTVLYHHCLLYTSDAADDLLCVDLGGRRIIKKKNN